MPEQRDTILGPLEAIGFDYAKPVRWKRERGRKPIVEMACLSESMMT